MRVKDRRIIEESCQWKGRWDKRKLKGATVAYNLVTVLAGRSGIRGIYLASILHIVLLPRLGADPGTGAGSALFRVTQDYGILVQVPSPLHCDADRPSLLTDIVATNT